MLELRQHLQTVRWSPNVLDFKVNCVFVNVPEKEISSMFTKNQQIFHRPSYNERFILLFLSQGSYYIIYIVLVCLFVCFLLLRIKDGQASA